ncbi:MAG: hypothetical protein MK411_12035, partial [SAR202 cluster bacterium]|nr:hypothetical protein [SAR202 cluster bacterium]
IPFLILGTVVIVAGTFVQRMFDRQATAVRYSNIKGLPTTFIVSRAGKVRWQTMGPQDFSGETMREIFETLSVERP